MKPSITLTTLLVAAATLALLCVATLCAAQTSTTTVTPTNTTRAPATAELVLTWEAYVSVATCVAVLLALMFDVIGCCPAMIIATTFLTLCGIISYQELFGGFGTTAVATIALLCIVADPIADLPAVQRAVAYALAGSSNTGSVTWPLFKIVFLCLLTSSFLNNTPQVALLTNLIKIYCREKGLYPSQFLMPMNFATLVGNYAIIGTSTTLVVDGIMRKAGMAPMEFFELAKINGPFTPIMLLYLVFAPYWLLPRDKGGLFRMIGSEELRRYVTGFKVKPDSPIVGHTVATITTALPATLDGIEVIQILRGEECFFPLNGIEIIDAGDVLLIKGDATQLRDLTLFAGLTRDDASAPKAIAAAASPTAPAAAPTVQVTSGSDDDGKPDAAQAADAPAPATSASKETSPTFVGEGANPTLVNSFSRMPRNTSAGDVDLFKRSFGSLAAAVGASRAAPAEEEYHQHHTTYFEVVLSGSCPHVGELVQSRTFQRRYKCSIIALRTAGGEDLLRDNIDAHALERGDLLLIIAHQGFREEWHLSGEFVVVNSVTETDVEATVRDHYIVVPDWFPCGHWVPMSVSKTNQKLPDTQPAHGDGAEAEMAQKPSAGGSNEPTAPAPAAAPEGEHGMQKVLLVPWWYQYLTVPIFIAMISVAIAGYEIALCALVAAIVVIGLGIVRTEAAIRAVEWEVVVMVAFSFGLGIAMTNSGFAGWLGQALKNANVSGLGLLYLVSVLSTIMTNVITNKACVQVLVPLIISIYRATGKDPLGGVMLCCAISSMALSTPYGFATNLMVMGPGGYKARDFVYFGVPLNILALAILPLIVYGVYPGTR